MKLGDGDFDWTDALLLFICVLLIGALAFTVDSMSKQEPIIITYNNTIIETIYVDRIITEYQIIEVERPVYVNRTIFVETPPVPLTDYPNTSVLYAWIITDETDTLDYDDRWTCMDFTLRTIKNAENEGYRVYFLYDRTNAHALCMAYVVKEAKYVVWEPQTDSVEWDWDSTVGGSPQVPQFHLSR